MRTDRIVCATKSKRRGPPQKAAATWAQNYLE